MHALLVVTMTRLLFRSHGGFSHKVSALFSALLRPSFGLRRFFAPHVRICEFWNFAFSSLVEICVRRASQCVLPTVHASSLFFSHHHFRQQAASHFRASMLFSLVILALAQALAQSCGPEGYNCAGYTKGNVCQVCVCVTCCAPSRFVDCRLRASTYSCWCALGSAIPRATSTTRAATTLPSSASRHRRRPFRLTPLAHASPKAGPTARQGVVCARRSLTSKRAA